MKETCAAPIFFVSVCHNNEIWLDNCPYQGDDVGQRAEEDRQSTFEVDSLDALHIRLAAFKLHHSKNSCCRTILGTWLPSSSISLSPSQ